MNIEVKKLANGWSAWDGQSIVAVGTVRQVAVRVKEYIVEQLARPDGAGDPPKSAAGEDR